jgi:hypothetical protein
MVGQGCEEAASGDWGGATVHERTTVHRAGSRYSSLDGATSSWSGMRWCVASSLLQKDFHRSHHFRFSAVNEG